jgi:hypothetical protein
LKTPFAGFERTQKVYPFFIHSAQQMGAEDRFEIVVLRERWQP